MFKDVFGYDINIPERYREIFMWLCQDLVSIQAKWNFYIDLFGKKENTTLLSDLAPSSFQIIEESLRRDLIMSLSRLSDPPSSRRENNISLKTLTDHFNHLDNIMNLISQFESSCKPIRKYRNKRIAHNDFTTRISPKELPLPGIKREQIDEILKITSDILNIIYRNYVNGEIVFKLVLIGDAVLY